ncbi:unnamed protein product [Linum trigynum]|uniref:non-specific serine/threonine protein kinase n=1 Tax=Linum trigynum TaxID=586398 RepID=A0AAV2CK74_9ROSI
MAAIGLPGEDDALGIGEAGKSFKIWKNLQQELQRQLERLFFFCRSGNSKSDEKKSASKFKIYIAMELVRGGELFSKFARGRLREDDARVYFQQLISAIDFCHSRGVYHLDLNPENLLLLPFQDDNLVAMYRKIYRGDFKCPPWFSSKSRRLVTKLLDPNPASRITISKVMESSWFRKSIPKTVRSNEEIEFDAFNCEEDEAKSENSKETLNAFHIISLSEGFDLSPLFEEKKRMEKEELRFATTRPASSLISLHHQHRLFTSPSSRSSSR